MRIISGQVSGQLLKFPKSKKIRPATSKVREAIFSILAQKTEKSFVLDLYAGSGSLGIEALSRGAKEAVFVDENKDSILMIRQNLNKIGFSKFSKIKKTSIENFFKYNKEKFDLIFVDPPWSQINLGIFLSMHKFLKQDGIIIFLHPKHFKIKNMNDLKIIDKRNYGDSGVTFFKIPSYQIPLK
jgi:16S rRNA (guanine966-N2)-methyltransferase